MVSRKSEALTMTNLLVAGMSLLILLLLPYPLFLLIGLGVPFGWAYYVAYAGWAVFAVLLVWLSVRSAPTWGPRWPHRRFAWISFAAFLLYGVLALSGFLRGLGPAGVLLFVALVVWMLVEGSFAGREQRLLRAQRQGARTR
jgi:hypothetical protein